MATIYAPPASYACLCQSQDARVSVTHGTGASATRSTRRANTPILPPRRRHATATAGTVRRSRERPASPPLRAVRLGRSGTHASLARPCRAEFDRCLYTCGLDDEPEPQRSNDAATSAGVSASVSWRGFESAASIPCAEGGNSSSYAAAAGVFLAPY